MKLIIGLGNPGREYAKTRHNTGFNVIDLIAEHFYVEVSQKKFKGLFTKFRILGQDVILLKPQTFMNLSGESVVQFVNFFKIKPENILVIADDLDLPVGKIRIKKAGSDGGQKGLGNIITHLGTEKINRLRVGIGKEEFISTIDYVLGQVKKEDLELYKDSLKRAAEAAVEFIRSDVDTVMNLYNGNETMLDKKEASEKTVNELAK